MENVKWEQKFTRVKQLFRKMHGLREMWATRQLGMWRASEKQCPGTWMSKRWIKRQKQTPTPIQSRGLRRAAWGHWYSSCEMGSQYQIFEQRNLSWCLYNTENILLESNKTQQGSNIRNSGKLEHGGSEHKDWMCSVVENQVVIWKWITEGKLVAE